MPFSRSGILLSPDCGKTCGITEIRPVSNIAIPVMTFSQKDAEVLSVQAEERKKIFD